MNNYLKLVNFEIRRFWKFYILLICVVVGTQIIGAIIDSSVFLNRANTIMQQEKLIESEYILRYGGGYTLTSFLNSGFFTFSVMFAIAVLIIYVFFIWYRDWLGKSSFIYRLLMLPTERLNVYFAKLTSILLFVLCLVSIQVVLLEGVEKIIQRIVPEQLYDNLDAFMVYSHNSLFFLYPATPLYFVLMYGLGITIVAIFFTAILLERSFHLKGIFMAVFYLIVSVGVILVPAFFNDNFYTEEILLMTIGCSILMLAAAIFTANYLLKRKITV